jgi:hypothetical protein
MMTLKQLIQLEDKAKEVWVISPTLNYDVKNADFSEIVSVNLGQKIKYRYIIPASKDIHKNIDLYKKKYHLTDLEINQNFLILAESDYLPFLMETGIYNGNSDDCVACVAPAITDGNDVIKLSPEESKKMADAFKAIWKKYKGVKI